MHGHSEGPFYQRLSEVSFSRVLNEFGSPYSSFSVCNRYATDPPVIVDGSGRFYGRLTLNHEHPQIIRSAPLLVWLEGLCS